MFATVYFYQFRNEFTMDGSEDDCDTMRGCFVANANYGMRLSGGIGDAMSHDITTRWSVGALIHQINCTFLSLYAFSSDY